DVYKRQLLFIVFAVKAGLFPFFVWLPDSYPQAPPAVTPYFSGILTKVGVFCLYRSHTLLFRTGWEDWFQPLLLAAGGATMIIGVLGALSRSSFRGILSFHIISQIGYMVFALGLCTQAGLAGGIIFIVHNVLAKSSLLMIAACVILQTGTDRLDRLGGLLARTPVLAGLFLFAAFSLAGLPPLSGFYGKYILVVEGITKGHYFVVFVSLLTSLLTLASMVKIWTYAFLGRESGDVRVPPARPLAVGAAGGLVLMVAAVMVFSGPLMSLSDRASATLLRPEIYIQAVRGAAGEMMP
ncbi:MAG: proton-conducting transporter membrane subunit, partial [Candidatus Sumerlaeaceae bacterium]|nr:proton-conducting transporter membrane subunit [Candidatus Sumerlaeaceae bacterium]